MGHVQLLLASVQGHGAEWEIIHAPVPKDRSLPRLLGTPLLFHEPRPTTLLAQAADPRCKSRCIIGKDLLVGAGISCSDRIIIAGKVYSRYV